MVVLYTRSITFRDLKLYHAECTAVPGVSRVTASVSPRPIRHPPVLRRHTPASPPLLSPLHASFLRHRSMSATTVLSFAVGARASASSMRSRARVAGAAPLTRATRRSAGRVPRAARLVTRAGAIEKVTKDELEKAMQVRTRNSPSVRWCCYGWFCYLEATPPECAFLFTRRLAVFGAPFSGRRRQSTAPIESVAR